VRLSVTDDGRGPAAPDGEAGVRGGTGLKGLTERLAAAGGTLTAGAGERAGFVVRAELPTTADVTEPVAG
jgi:two-component system sensor histidine kinase DesK